MLAKISLVPRPSITANTVEGYASLVPRPSIVANAVEGLVKLLRRMTSGGRLPDVILRRSFTRPSTSLVPRPSPHVRERGSGVLNDFSCQMGQGSFPDQRARIRLQNA